jgi:transposase
MVDLVLRDEQWKRIERLVPGKPGDRGRSGDDNRRFIEAVLWISGTGSSWRDLPESFGAWNSVYVRFARWSKAGVWHKVSAELAAEGEESFLDSTIVRANRVLRRTRKQNAGRRQGARRCSKLAELRGA